MGCASSNYQRNKFANGEVMYKAARAIGNHYGRKPFTSEQVIIIKQTWACLAEDIHVNGLQIFLRIFELCPSVKSLFFVADVRHSEIARNALIKAHGVRFMNAIGSVVENIEECEADESEVSKLLILLGQQHKKHAGFKSEYFECFYEALMWRWEYCIGKQFISEVADAWSHLFIYMMEKLLEGYRTPG